MGISLATFGVYVDDENVQHKEDLPTGIMQVLGWSAMAVNLDEVTVDNLAEWNARLHIETMMDMIIIGAGDHGPARNLLPQEMEQLIGAKIPGVQNLTREEYINKFPSRIDRKMGDFAYQLKREDAKVSEEAHKIVQFAIITKEEPKENLADAV